MKTLALLGFIAIAGTVGIVVREKLRPSAPRYGRESDDWGDQPAVNLLCHFGTFTRKGQCNHVSR